MINCERYGRGERQVGGCERAEDQVVASTGWAGGERASGRTERQGRGSHAKENGHKSGRTRNKKRGWAHPPPSFPRERGEEERRVHPPIVTEQGTEKSEE